MEHMTAFRKKISPLLLLGVILCSTIFQPIQVHAQEKDIDEQYYDSNGIIWFNPNAVLPCETTGGVAGGLTGKDNIEKALSFYMGQGFNLAQAAGILGNYIAESGVDPAKEQGGRIVDDSYLPINGVGIGIAQWTWTSRQKPLMDFLSSQGVGITSLSGQLSFSMKEMQTTHKAAFDAVKAATTPLEAAFAFHKYYEGSADSIDQIRTNRGGNADKLYEAYKDAPPLAGTSDTNLPERCASGATGNLGQTLMSYAWPDYRGPTTGSRPPETEGWTKAWQTAKAAGFYVGGIKYPGIDCGGFVTRLLIDSGFDANYNSGGKGGPTGAQESWAKTNWTSLGTGANVKVGGDLSDPSVLRTGDVAIMNRGLEGHTFIYVGKVTGFGSEIASASLDNRAPMADTQQSATDATFNWYRKK